MAKIAFLLLCHKDPEGVIRQAEQLTAAGDCIAIHFDKRASPADFRRIEAALKDNPDAVLVRRRVRCGWGEWSLVEATLRAAAAAEAAFPRATHFYLLSGDCMPAKSAVFAHDLLDRDDADYIESFDFFRSDWIKTGLKEDRLIYRHPFNERRHKRLFDAAHALQKRLGLARPIPAGLQMMIGSQWWCLRRQTIEGILRFTHERSDVMRFFRSTWIPDETFFQTLVRHLVPATEIRCRTLTFLMFSDYGMPVTFYNDHLGLLLTQDFLFARKISVDAGDLKAQLGALYASGRVGFDLSNEGRRLYGFLTGRGRVGRRFAPRAWEAGGTLGRERELLVILCKKWHVAKRLADLIGAETGIPALHYLFTEAEAWLPDLGGIETTLDKRTRHRRAVLRLLYDHYGSDRLAICLDPAQFEVLGDLYSDRARVRTLEVDCRFSDDYLAGHARRVGLAGPTTHPDTIAGLLPTLRHDIAHEADRIRDAGLANLGRLAELAHPDENAAALSRFLGVGREVALRVAATDYLFTD
jgi:hypothetical protein